MARHPEFNICRRSVLLPRMPVLIPSFLHFLANLFATVSHLMFQLHRILRISVLLPVRPLGHFHLAWLDHKVLKVPLVTLALLVPPEFVALQVLKVSKAFLERTERTERTELSAPWASEVIQALLELTAHLVLLDLLDLQDPQALLDLQDLLAAVVVVVTHGPLHLGIAPTLLKV